MTIANYTIRDAHPARALTSPRCCRRPPTSVSQRSRSALPSEAMWDLFRRVGIGSRTAARLSGGDGRAFAPLQELAPDRTGDDGLRPWRLGESGAAGACLHRVRARRRPGSAHAAAPRRARPMAQKILSTETARVVRAMLETAVQPGGTGLRARVVGWRVAGKTGTSHKLVNGSYAPDKYLSSFVGFAPVSAATPGGGGDDRRALGARILRRRGCSARVRADS